MVVARSFFGGKITVYPLNNRMRQEGEVGETVKSAVSQQLLPPSATDASSYGEEFHESAHTNKTKYTMTAVGRI